ncbi:MAG: transcriptional regulator [Deltaproteobacteria bacterium]|nr:MAG: transcriptional regulator [Deltaproteobacteria bacterium]
MVTNQELEHLLQDLESDRVERKASAGDRSKIRRTICAFANDLPGHGQPGVIFIGINDDGRCSNLRITDELLKTLSSMRSDGNILPPPTMVVQKHILNGCELVVIAVEPSDSPPVRYQGRVWIRVGPRLDIATNEDERRLAGRRRAVDLPFDYRPVQGASLEDLDIDFFRKTYLPSAIPPDVLEQNQRPVEQQLASLRFLTKENIPNFGAILVLGKESPAWIPCAYVQFLRIEGRLLTDPIKNSKKLAGPLINVLDLLDELLRINISATIDVISSSQEIQRPDYPVMALLQLVRNAVMHRSYENTNAPVKVYWFSDRIEISNPGGLYGQVNPENFGKGATDYRNPLIAESMRVLGYVQRFGMGIQLAKHELEQNGNPPPEFQFEPGSFLVTVRISS